MSRTNGIDTFDLVQNLRTTIGDETKTFTVDYDRTGTGTSGTDTLYFYATHSSGPITSTAMGHLHNGQWDTWNFGSTANLGDLQVSFSKSFMYQTTRLFGSIEFLSGNTRASARIRQVNDVTAAMGEFSYESAIDKYLQIGIGKVSGTTTDGRRVDDSYGKVAFSLPVQRFFPWSPTHVVVSSAWHNSDTSGGDQMLTSTPPTITQGTLFIMHDALRSDIWGHIDQFWFQFALPY